jgi:hypothetical protein
MSEKKIPSRDEKGDIKYNLDPFDWDKFRKARFTYIFHYYNEERNYYFPCFGLFDIDDEEFEEASKDPDFFEKHLYQTPYNPPFDFDLYFNHHRWQLNLLIEYFKEVFEERAFIDGFHPQNKFYQVILPKSKYFEIMNCINDFGLLQIRDLLLEIISIAQDKYVEHIAFWERPENQKLITTAKTETQKIIDIIEKLDYKKWLRGDPMAKMPPELYYINFVFSDGAIKVEHKWLTKEFIDYFKKHYDDLPYKNWKIDLARYPERFEDNIKKQQFKYKLAKSFYNLFTKGGFFKVTKKNPKPNNLMLFISKLLEFCLIPVGDEGELDEIKIKHIRNWVTRKDFRPAITYVEVPPDEKRLRKYFSFDLLHISNEPCRADAIYLGMFIAKRFNIEHLIQDLIHIAKSLSNRNLFRDHQLSTEGPMRPAPFPEFKAFSKLVKGINQKKKITSIKFIVEGDDNEYQLQQPLPLYLIGQAIKDYYEDQKVEFESDLIKSKYIENADGSVKIKRSDYFNLPEERFMIRFVKSFYNYLLAEAPPGERDVIPSERYYSIIALMLQKSWFFYQQNDPEWFIVAKVKQWHNLSLGK